MFINYVTASGGGPFEPILFEQIRKLDLKNRTFLFEQSAQNGFFSLPITCQYARYLFASILILIWKLLSIKKLIFFSQCVVKINVYCHRIDMCCCCCCCCCCCRCCCCYCSSCCRNDNIIQMWKLSNWICGEIKFSYKNISSVFYFYNVIFCHNFVLVLVNGLMIRKYSLPT